MTQKAGSHQLDNLTADPTDPGDGEVWFRSDLNETRARVDGITETLLSFSVLDYRYVASDAELGDVTEVFVTKATIAATDLNTSGNYILFWTVKGQATTNGTGIEVEIDRDGVGQMWSMDFVDGTTQHIAAGFQVITDPSAVETFDLNFRRSAGSGTANVSFARMFLLRIL